MYGLVSGRLGMASMGLGIAEACLSEAVAYANKRVAFGKPIAALYAIQEMISQIYVKITASRLMIMDVATKMDTNVDCSLDTSVVKLFVSEMVRDACHMSLQIFGGHGYLRGCNVERYARDGRLMDIGVGATEVLKMVVGSQILKSGYKER